jgi:hypothetical protein
MSSPFSQNLPFFPGGAGIHSISGHGGKIGGKRRDRQRFSLGPDDKKDLLYDLPRIRIGPEMLVGQEIELLPIPVVEFSIGQLIVFSYISKQFVIIEGAVHFKFYTPLSC